MTDTPRTDSATWHTKTPGDPIGAEVVFQSFARKLELELNAANERIKRLEEAGNEMAEWLNSPRNLGGDSYLVQKWSKAKEAKP